MNRRNTIGFDPLDCPKVHADDFSELLLGIGVLYAQFPNQPAVYLHGHLSHPRRTDRVEISRGRWASQRFLRDNLTTLLRLDRANIGGAQSPRSRTLSRQWYW
jgi:hypothetical protein